MGLAYAVQGNLTRKTLSEGEEQRGFTSVLFVVFMAWGVVPISGYLFSLMVE